jgi:mono/diheme cytochrome c family protein
MLSAPEKGVHVGWRCGLGGILVLAAAALGCGSQEAGEPPTSPPPAKPAPAPTPAPAPAPAPPAPGGGASAGAALFAARCVTCHGTNGAGDGPASVGLTPRPRDFRDPAWQAKVTDAHIEEIIAKGGAAVGLSPLMPPQPDLSAAQREALRLHVRGFKR